MGEGENGREGEEQPKTRNSQVSTDYRADYKADFQDLNGHPDNLEGGFNKEFS